MGLDVAGAFLRSTNTEENRSPARVGIGVGATCWHSPGACDGVAADVEGEGLVTCACGLSSGVPAVAEGVVVDSAVGVIDGHGTESAPCERGADADAVGVAVWVSILLEGSVRMT